MLELIDLEKMPSHVALIMDGNGRWARKRHMPRIFGHRKGMETVREILKAARDIGIEFITLYAFSAENWSRPRAEVSALMHLLQDYLKQEIDELDETNVKMLTIGNTSKLPGYARNELESAKMRLNKNDGQKLILALNYGGRAEITMMAQRIATLAAKKEIKPAQITEEMISENLYTAGTPDPDLMIRTSGEFRISNFLLWQLAYSEILITDTLWPDFNRAEFFSSIAKYQKRDRRYGGVKKES
ncbi:MAG: isoprenyl transferase [Candidatus Lindowbacteria bacterium]|nr:isoprenyl transferase [Candidatus Lindowbacteria bacterium]